MFGILFATVC